MVEEEEVEKAEVGVCDPLYVGMYDVTADDGPDDGDDDDGDDDGCCDGDDNDNDEEPGRFPSAELLPFRWVAFLSDSPAGPEVEVVRCPAGNTRRVDTSSTRVRLILVLMVTCDL